MADVHQLPGLAPTYTPKGTGRAHKYHHAPPERIQEVPGVRKRSGTREDIYTGSKEQLIRAGLMRDGNFPGDPGKPLSALALWPYETLSGSVWPVPGLLRITRAPSGLFSARLVVAADEQARRQAREDAEKARREARRDTEKRLRDIDLALCQIIETFGADVVLKFVHSMKRQGKPIRNPGHLRLAWVAPSP